MDGHFYLAAMILFTVKVVGLKLLLFDVHGNLNAKSTGFFSALNHNILLYRVLIECAPLDRAVHVVSTVFCFY